MSKIFIPSLDEQQDDVVTSPKAIVQKILAFLITNPGDTSELHEERGGSLGKLDMEHNGDASILPAMYQDMIQSHINSAFGSAEFTVEVKAGEVIDKETKKVSKTESKLLIKIMDSSGNVIVVDDKSVSKTKTE